MAGGLALLGILASVTIGPTHVGPLQLGHATATQVRSFAGTPQQVSTFRPNGELGDNGLFFADATAYLYGCRGQRGCDTVYALRRGVLIGLWTRLPAFRTAAGTHVGTPLAAARRAEKHAKWSGSSGVQCPALLFPGQTEFKADISDVKSTPAHVVDFLVTIAPQSFSDGC